MKRSGPPKRKAPLARKSPLAASPGRSLARSPTKVARAVSRALEPGEAEWKRKRSGSCAVCGEYGRIVWHHVVDKQTLGKLEKPLYDPRNALVVGAPVPWGGRCRCHDDHTFRGIQDKRIPHEKIPSAAREFAVEALGEGPAYEYFQRHYR